MKEILKRRKVHIIATCSAVAIAGILLFQGAIPKAESSVTINAISPNQGPIGTEVVISGSGFSTSVQGITGTQINGKVYAPGNYVLIQSDVLNQPMLSPDGKTLTFHVELISDNVKADCDASLAKIKPGSCKIQIKVVNAYGVMSRGQYFTITKSSNVKPIYTITATQGANGTISPALATVTSGSNQTFTITPLTGYQVASVSVDGVNQDAIPTYTFTNVISPHSITATFIQSCSLTVSRASDSPTAQNITPGQSGVTLVKFNATSNCDGTLNSFAVSLLPMPNGYQNISTLRLYDDVGGVQLGTTQNVTIAGMNFPSVNKPLTANQTLVLRVVGDISPSAVIGSTVYGVFGGSYGVTSSGGVIGNNASGNLISGNTMTIAAIPTVQYIAPGTNPRIMYWWGKVNQHTDTNGNWLTDPDGVSGADLDKLTYCKKFYQNTLGVEDYMLETTDTWRDRGNVGGPYTSTKMSTRCLQPS